MTLNSCSSCPSPPKPWKYRYALSHPVYATLGMKPQTLHARCTLSQLSYHTTSFKLFEGTNCPQILVLCSQIQCTGECPKRSPVPTALFSRCWLTYGMNQAKGRWLLGGQAAKAWSKPPRAGQTQQGIKDPPGAGQVQQSSGDRHSRAQGP